MKRLSVLKLKVSDVLPGAAAVLLPARVACGAAAPRTYPVAETMPVPQPVADSAPVPQPMTGPTPVAQPAPAFAEVRAELGTKGGGTLRVIGAGNPPHFDFVLSQSFTNLTPPGGMYDTLLKPGPWDSGRSIIPDLAHSCEISENGLCKTYHL